MTVFLLLVSLIFWTLVYSGCCAKEGFDKRQQVKLLRPSNMAGEYKELFDFIDEVQSYFDNKLGGDTGRTDELISKFPLLSKNSHTAHYAGTPYDLARWAGSVKLDEINNWHWETYKSKYQKSLKTQGLWMMHYAVCPNGFDQNEYDRYTLKLSVSKLESMSFQMVSPVIIQN